MPDRIVVLQHGKKVGWFNGHGSPADNAAFGDVYSAELVEVGNAAVAAGTSLNTFADIFEPIDAVITADSTFYTADNATWPTADGGILEGATDALDAIVIAISAAVEAADATDILDAVAVAAADVVEAADAADILDADVIAAGAAVVHEAASAADVLDADVIAAEVPVSGGAYYRPLRPFPVEGIGYGILPQLEGEAHGIVILAGAGVGALPGLVGTAAGAVGAAGRSTARLVLRAAASGNHGQAGTASAALKELSAAGDGAVGARGLGVGTLVMFNAIASGRHDDDEAAVMIFLLAA